MTGVVKLAPSILSADFAHLGERVKQAEQAGADRIHVQDVAQVLIMSSRSRFCASAIHPCGATEDPRVRRMIELAKARCEVEVDGVIDSETAPLTVAAGAEVLVAGTAIFNEGQSVAGAMDRLRASVRPQEQQRQVHIA